MFTQIENLFKNWKALPPISTENQQKLDKKFRLEFSYNSNHIEGNTLTYGETQLLLFFDKTESLHELREYEEMKAHDVAYKMIGEWAKEHTRPLNETDIKQLNEIILVRPFWKEAITPDGQATRRQIKVGQYKEFPNSVRLQNGELFDYASPADTPIKMNELMQWFHSEWQKKDLHPVALAALLHYKFVCIHPFDDGNGRISRLLMNYVLLAHNLPPVIIKSSDKRNYLNALNQADVGNIEAFVSYIAQQLVWSLELCIKATKNEGIDEQDDVLKEIELYKKSQLAKLNKENIKSETFIQERFQDTLCPIMLGIEKNLSSFKDLFIFYQEAFAIRVYPSETKYCRFVQLQSVFEKLTSVIDVTWNITLDKSINDKIKTIHLPVKISFEATEIKIQFDNQDIVTLPYQTPTMAYKIDEIVLKCTTLAFEKIKKNTIV